MIDEFKPRNNDIVIPRTPPSLFNSANFEEVLHKRQIESVSVMGLVTDQCGETAVRDGCDRGFLMMLVDDACATYSQQRHAGSIVGFKGYCRTRAADELIAGLECNRHEHQVA
jgi:nicotinamidase-related amidase